jgi:uncharacterized membrane protein YcaP (DUF421 family)
MDHMWHDIFVHMFVLTLPLLEKIIRPIVVYFFLLIGLRLAGKRELAQLNPFDFIVLMTLSNTVQNAIIGDDNTVLGGMIGAAALIAINYAVVRSARNSRFLQRLLAGRGSILVKDGVIQKDHLDREMINKAELLAAAHKQGIMSLRDVEYCVLEPTGTLTFIQRKPTADSMRHDEIMTLLNKMSEAVEKLKQTERETHGDLPPGQVPS